jgi:hypothetical protein
MIHCMDANTYLALLIFFCLKFASWKYEGEMTVQAEGRLFTSSNKPNMRRSIAKSGLK